jgi:predicted phosphodiesterase
MVTYHQAKLNLRRKRPELQLIPARSDGWIAPPRSRASIKGTKLIVVMGDQQAPYFDENLHYLSCAWLEENDPDEITLLGDTVDYPEISRHRLDPENTATVNECTQSAHDLLRGVRTAAPNARIRKLAGNHDERLRNILLDKPSVQPLYGAKQADSPEEQGALALGLPFLLRLDELGIEYIDPKGAYDLAQINLSDKLAVRHGWIAKKGSGTSALATLEHLGYSVIVGHTHRQSIVYKTTHDIDGATTTLTAAEAGCMCRVDQTPLKGRKWPNFTPLPDWVQGFTTVTVHPDGFFRIENATYVNKTLLWRNQQYR